jgi:PAT family beta-lactamase induction signal transducer AmpG
LSETQTLQEPEDRTWRTALLAFKNPQVVTMLFLGLAAGMPLLLIFSSLSLWLREAGVDRATVTFFSWAALGYSFKFVWAPLVDRLPLPFFTRVLGRRRAWMLVSQLMIISAIVWMASTDPSASGDALTRIALAAVLLGFSSATQDIVIDAFRIESAKPSLQAMMSSTYIAGYRIGMLLAGAGALYLASYFGSELGQYDYQAWRMTYLIMGACMLVGVATTLIINEPAVNRTVEHQHSTADYAGFVLMFMLAISAFVLSFVLLGQLFDAFLGEASPLQAFALEVSRMLVSLAIAVCTGLSISATRWVNREMVLDTYVAPVSEFFSRYGLKLSLLILALVGLYRISDIVLGVISNVFYQDLLFTKNEIATVVKTFGLFMTILGGFLGGLLSVRYGVMRILFVGALLTVVTNLFFILLAVIGKNEFLLYLVISADNLTAGLASAAFIAFLSALTNVRFTAVQYAIFSSLMTLIPKLVGGYSGTVVDNFGYVNFFLFAGFIGLPVLLLLWLACKHLHLEEPQFKTDSNL